MADIPPCLISGNMVPLVGFGDLLMARTDGIRTTLTAYISVARQRAIQQSPSKKHFLSKERWSRTRIKGCRCGMITSDRLVSENRLLSLVIPLQRLSIIIIALVIEVRRFCSMSETNFLS